jgi:hypothetical protein
MIHEAGLVELPHQCVLPASSTEYQDTKGHEGVLELTAHQILKICTR